MNDVAMRVGVTNRKVHECPRLTREQLVSQRGERCDALVLHGERFAVHEGHVHEHSGVRWQHTIVAALQTLERRSHGSFVRREHPGCIAEHIAGELIQHNHIGESALGGILPSLVRSSHDLRVQPSEPLSDLCVECGIFSEPALRLSFAGQAKFA